MLNLSKKRKFKHEGISLLPKDLFSIILSWIPILDRFLDVTLVSRNWRKIATEFSRSDKSSLLQSGFVQSQISILNQDWPRLQLFSHFSRLSMIKKLLPIFGTHLLYEMQYMHSSFMIHLFDSVNLTSTKEFSIPSSIPHYLASKLLSQKFDPPLRLLCLFSSFFCSLACLRF